MAGLLLLVAAALTFGMREKAKREPAEVPPADHGAVPLGRGLGLPR
jgi:hypothetical protein